MTLWPLATITMAAAMSIAPTIAHAQTTLLNVSYDSTRELYADIDRAFIANWRARTGERVTIHMSNGGSGAQARAVIDGLEADVVSLGLQPDIDAIAKQANLLPAGWRDRLPNHSSPYTSTIVFVVRRGNPKGIHDWPDLIKPGVSVITANPKTSGGARWNYLAAWGFALRQPGGNADTAKAFVRALYADVPVLDSSARASTITFARRNQGDVLLAWENDAQLAVRRLGAGRLEVVFPSVTIKAEPVVAMVDEVVALHHTAKQADAFLQYLYTPEAQEIIATHYFRPAEPEVEARHADLLPPLKTFTVEEMFGSWREVQIAHFGEGGIFDQIYQPVK